MARKPKSIRLTSGELQILSMLWERGPLTLSQAHQHFGSYGRPTTYPTMQTRLNRLVAKGHVARGEARPASYRAVITPDQVRAGHLDLLLNHLGRSSVVPLVAHLVSERPLSPAEIVELKRLLAQAEKSAH